MPVLRLPESQFVPCFLLPSLLPTAPSLLLHLSSLVSSNLISMVVMH